MTSTAELTARAGDDQRATAPFHVGVTLSPERFSLICCTAAAARVSRKEDRERQHQQRGLQAPRSVAPAVAPSHLRRANLYRSPQANKAATSSRDPLASGGSARRLESPSDCSC